MKSFKVRADDLMDLLDEYDAAAVICDEVRHPHGGYCETVDWVNGTFYCATIIRKGNE